MDDGLNTLNELTAEIAAAGFTNIRLTGQNDAIGSAWLTAVKP